MIAIEQVDQIEVFVNESGTITVRQTAMYDEESLVVFDARYASAICKAIRDAAKEARELK